MFSIAPNLSAIQLGRLNLVQRIASRLGKYSVSINRLELELTESTINSSDMASNILDELANLGLKFALDDFGTGYSSLERLSRHPFKVLKVDKSFFASIKNSKSDISFLKAIHAFAKRLV